MSPLEHDAVRSVVREVLDTLLPELVDRVLTDAGAPRTSMETAPTNAVRVSASPRAPSAALHAEPAVARVPAPPVAAVHRPSGWRADTTPATVEHGDGAEPPSGVDGEAETEVVIETNGDLEAFARRLLTIYENPRDRQAVRSGKMRFRLRSRPSAASSAAERATQSLRVEKGPVTERMVKEAASLGRRIVLGPGAVLTPMGRDAARTLHVEVEKEKRC